MVYSLWSRLLVYLYSEVHESHEFCDFLCCIKKCSLYYCCFYSDPSNDIFTIKVSTKPSRRLEIITSLALSLCELGLRVSASEGDNTTALIVPYEPEPELPCVSCEILPGLILAAPVQHDAPCSAFQSGILQEDPLLGLLYVEPYVLSPPPTVPSR